MDNSETVLKCPCCEETFSTEEEKISHIKSEHEYHRLTPQPKIGRKYQRIVGQIENCFIAYRKQNVQVLTVTEIESWFKNNTKAGLAKQRIASLLRRRPQFQMHKKARRINSNEIEGENIESYKRAKILYPSIEEAITACLKFFGNGKEDSNFGTWSKIIQDYDPFIDGMSSMRLKDHIDKYRV